MSFAVWNSRNDNEYDLCLAMAASWNMKTHCHDCECTLLIREGERFYLRILLNHVMALPASRIFALFPTVHFDKEAACHRGIPEDDICVVLWNMPSQLKFCSIRSL